MKTGFTSRQLEYSKWSNMLHAHGSPLPRQGEGEGEGLFEGTRAGSETPHLSPLPLSKGRRREDTRWVRRESWQSERGGDDSSHKTRN
jgi:hypothetical protein